MRIRRAIIAAVGMAAVGLTAFALSAANLVAVASAFHPFVYAHA
jgi:hypothetical protein